MNYLAHLLLAEPGDDALLGALLGDFVKGPLAADLAPGLARGIRLHRLVDAYTDAHPVHRRSRGRFVAPRRRFAGIIVDVAYDHFLCRRWPEYSARPLHELTGRVYGLLRRRRASLPARLRDVAPRMIERDWLGGYGDLDRLGRALDGVAGRLRRGHAMRGALDEVRGAYAELEADFRAFFPDLRAFADACKRDGRLDPEPGPSARPRRLA